MEYNVAYKSIFYLFVLLFINQLTYSKEISKPKGGIKQKVLSIKEWNPPSSLSTHFGHGTWARNEPIFNFNLNLGYVRYFMKNDADSAADFNTRFSYIIELKPLDFISFLTSGSPYAIYMEDNEWLRNITFIFTNKIYSSTQFISDELRWYFDFIYNAIAINAAIVPNSFTQPSALSRFYPSNRRSSIGLSDHFHLYRDSKMALGIKMFFEMTLPKGTEQVVRVASSAKANLLNSSDLSYAAMGGFYFRRKVNNIDMNAQVLYQRIQGNYDDEVIAFGENTLKAKYTISVNDQIFAHLLYYYVSWFNENIDEKFNSHTFNIGSEIKGFGDQLQWLGAGFDFFYQRMDQSFIFKGSNDRGDLNAYIFLVSANFYPLAFHSKNHRLKVSLIYGQFKYDWQAVRSNQTVNFKEDGWNYSVMLKVNYSF